MTKTLSYSMCCLTNIRDDNRCMPYLYILYEVINMYRYTYNKHTKPYALIIIKCNASDPNTSHGLIELV